MKLFKWEVMLVMASFLTFSLSSFAQETKKKEPKIYKEVSGNFKVDYRYFPEDGLYDGQHNEYFSMVFQPEIYLEWNKGKDILQFTGFGRIDQYDTKRTHADVRELYWQHIYKKWEVSVGVKKIFWGVTESNHVVDIINQSDALEGFDLEQKLGQPMVHASWSPKWGTLDFYAMTYFRQMKFPGPQGRLRPPFSVDQSRTTFEGNRDEYSPDLAVRWSNSMGIFDIGLSHFYGSSRAPLLETKDGVNFNTHYELINQSGLDLQASTGSMLWKGELIYRVSDRKSINAFTVGGEYTFSNIYKSGIDIGLMAEYNYDNRGIELISSMDDDFFFGTRFAFNDRQSTDFVGGVIIDRNNQSTRYVVEANRRIGDSWKFTIESSGFFNIAKSEFLYLLRNDSFIQFSLAKYF